ncbi:MAG: flippase-like domain-containing protein [Bacteroidetes bacterium]|nr:flippase-like domain-containing protein [Bacteroidota bacterium]MBU1371472.1 flippase-like domain-containing protein [Bacteroidota bacterium]MBU1485702.1 flippase-like domain-containing protein [Bacteroidota bacterium]MBU1759507.1 flippase-like domain-containing protein [Bacteroidota bacterium]MBU2268955.1 flippase-like domain-containing protein [Bacteroidota bacterium]
MNKTQKKIFSYTIKLLIVTLAGIFIYRKLLDNDNLKNFNEIILGLKKWQVWLTLIVIFLLMFVNWFLESIKWKFLISKVEKISLYKAIESVFCGLTWAIFTPNRVGEYGGRIFFLSPRKRIQGMVAMVVGSISQLIITNILGSIATLWFLSKFIPMDNVLLFAISILVIGFCLFFLIFYFNIKWLFKLLNSIGFLKKFQKFFSVLTRYNKRELSKILLLSISRFTVFTTQYLLVIHLLIPDIHLYESAFMIFILFFVQSALPSLDLLDIGVRSMTATYFFSFITHQEIAVMTATALIWLINLIIPAILGSFFVFKLNFFDQRN